MPGQCPLNRRSCRRGPPCCLRHLEAPHQLRRECHTAAGGNAGSLGREELVQYVCGGGGGITWPPISSGGVATLMQAAMPAACTYRWGGQCGHLTDEVSMFIYDCRQLDYCETSRAKPGRGPSHSLTQQQQQRQQPWLSRTHPHHSPSGCPSPWPAPAAVPCTA